MIEPTCQFEPKAWGSVAHCFATDRASISFLRVRQGTRCSLHFHRERANSFTVLSGEIIVEEGKTGINGIILFSRAYRLKTGESHTVPSGVLHRFRVLESGEVVEIYWPDKGGTVRLDDIERLDEGGEDTP